MILANEPGQLKTKRSFQETDVAVHVRDLVKNRRQIVDFAEQHVKNSDETEEAIGRYGVELRDFLWNAISIQRALTLDADPAEPLLSEAFEFCELNPKNPWHWRLLLEALVEAALKQSGAKTKWTETQYFELMIDVRELQKQEPAMSNNKEIAARLRKKQPFKTKYEGFGLDYLRKRVGRACDPAVNPLADFKLGDNLAEFIAARRGLDLPQDLVRSYMQSIADNETEQALAWLRKRHEDNGLVWGEADHQQYLPVIEAALAIKMKGSAK